MGSACDWKTILHDTEETGLNHLKNVARNVLQQFSRDLTRAIRRPSVQQ